MYSPGLQDQLRCLAVKQGSLMVGTRYWAKQALTNVLSHTQAVSMKLLLQQPELSYDKPETGALMVVCFTAAGANMQSFSCISVAMMLYVRHQAPIPYRI